MGGSPRSGPNERPIGAIDPDERAARSSSARPAPRLGPARDLPPPSHGYFQQPNPDALVEPAPALHGVPHGLRYRPVRAGVHISRKELGRQAVAAL